MIRETVRYVMRTFPKARNMDWYLYLKVLTEGYGIDPMTPLGDIPFGDLPSYSTVRRRRAEIQNVNGELLPTDPAVIVARKIWSIGSMGVCPLEILASETDIRVNLLSICRKCERPKEGNCPRRNGGIEGAHYRVVG